MSAQDPNGKHHSSFGDKIRGTAHIVHGMGENIRGSVLGAVESLSGSDEAKAKDEEIVSKGRSEFEQGVAQFKGIAAHDSGQPAKQEVPVPTKATETEPGKSGQIDPSTTLNTASQSQSTSEGVADVPQKPASGV